MPSQPNNPFFTEALAERHRRFTAQFVIPAMGLVSIVFFIAYVRADVTSALAATAGIIGALINGYVTSHPRLSIGGTSIDLRSPRADTARWLLNLGVLNPAQSLWLEIDPAAAVIGWTILLVACSSELYGNRYSNFVCVLGLLFGIVLLWNLGMQNIRTLALTIAAMGSVLFVVRKLSQFWLGSLTDLQAAAIRETEAQHQLSMVMRDAQIGAQSRLIAHELNNLITILDYSVQFQSDDAVAKRERSMAHIRRINALVLNDINNTKRIMDRSIADILEDVRILLRPDIVRRDVDFEVQVGADVSDQRVRENFGSIFLILRNLAVNASEAARPGQMPKVTLRVGMGSHHFIEFAIIDQGQGLEDRQLQLLLEGAGQSSKAQGHGLGLRFVKDQCDLNGFQLSAESTSGQGSTFTVRVPALAAEEHTETKSDARHESGATSNPRVA